MTKSYKEIVATCQLCGYEEAWIGRTEHWLDEDWEYYCSWFFSNDTEIPNTIYTYPL